MQDTVCTGSNFHYFMHDSLKNILLAPNGNF